MYAFSGTCWTGELSLEVAEVLLSCWAVLSNWEEDSRTTLSLDSMVCFLVIFAMGDVGISCVVFLTNDWLSEERRLFLVCVWVASTWACSCWAFSNVSLQYEHLVTLSVGSVDGEATSATSGTSPFAGGPIGHWMSAWLEVSIEGTLEFSVTLESSGTVDSPGIFEPSEAVVTSATLLSSEDKCWDWRLTGSCSNFFSCWASSASPSGH